MLSLLSLIIECSIVASLYVAIGGLLHALAYLDDRQARAPALSQLASWPIQLVVDLVLAGRASEKR